MIRIGSGSMNKILKIGIDVGSTTVKMIVVDQKNQIIFSDYRRHYSDTKKTINDLFLDILEKFPNHTFSLSMTGSGAITLAKYLNIPFVQEVIACRNAIKKYAPGVDVAIELGGEDAKIIYFDQTIEQRMNASCAGGTGAFLDQMAVLLNTTTEGLNLLAQKGENIYQVSFISQKVYKFIFINSNFFNYSICIYLRIVYHIYSFVFF